jgi:hypothetical protein
LARKESDGSRDTTSLEERRAVKSTVQRAMEQVLGLQPGTAHLVSRIPNDKEISEPEARAVREVLRQRYPHRKLSDMVKQAEAIDALLRDDPVQGRLALMRNYHQVSVENIPAFKPRQYADGLRGSLQRARQDQEDESDLREASAKYGLNLNQVLKQIEAFDRAMLESPSYTSARLSANYGAPSVPEDIPGYESRMAARQVEKAKAERYNEILRGVQLAIHHGHIPGDSGTLYEIAAIMNDRSRFQHSPYLIDTLKRAAQIAVHPDHVPLTGKRRSPRGSDAGSRSISGGPNTSHDSTRSSVRNRNGIRESIDRAMAQ